MKKVRKPAGTAALQRHAVSQKVNMNSVGAVETAASPYTPRDGEFEPINMELTSATASKKTYMIGDPKGLVAKVHGLSPETADAGTVDPATFNKMLDTRPLSIKGINYEVTNKTQFSKEFKYLSADLDAEQNANSINWSASRRKNAEDKTILTKEFREAFPLDDLHALKVVVENDSVVLSFFVQATIR